MLRDAQVPPGEAGPPCLRVDNLRSRMSTSRLAALRCPAKESVRVDQRGRSVPYMYNSILDRGAL